MLLIVIHNINNNVIHNNNNNLKSLKLCLIMLFIKIAIFSNIFKDVVKYANLDVNNQIYTKFSNFHQSLL